MILGKNVLDAKYLGGELKVGKITGFKTRISHFEMECYCGKVFFPDFNHDANLWVNCHVTPVRLEGYHNKYFDRYYDYLSCDKYCKIGDFKKEGSMYIFKECASDNCGNIIPVQKNGKAEGKFNSSIKYCTKCNPPKDNTFLSDRTIKMRKTKEMKEKKKQKAFESRFYQGGSPGLKSQK